MITKKIYNIRKDLTETRNNTREAVKTLEETGELLAKKSKKIVSRKVLKEIVAEELRRRDIWERAEAETKRIADGRPVWAIKCPDYETWLQKEIPFRADYAYCMTIRKYLEREGICAVLQMYDDWYCDIGADVELVIACRRDYHPDRRVSGRTNAMWLVCLPKNLTEEMADRYDLVLVDSVSLADEINSRSLAEAKPFIVPADTDLFYRGDSPAVYDRVFVGHTRGFNRDCVRWCSENKIELDVWGSGWEKYYENDPYIHLHGVISYDETAEIYRKSRIIINDHHPDMIETGMINNRCPEVLLCGKTMLCDWSQGIEDEFGDLFTYYHDETDFIEALEKAEESYDRKCAEIDRRYDELTEKYSFASGIRRMISLIDSVRGDTETEISG